MSKRNMKTKQRSRRVAFKPGWVQLPTPRNVLAEQSGATGINDLPVELLFLIVEELGNDRDAISSILRTGRDLSEVAAYHRYSNLVVGGVKAKRCFAMLASGSALSVLYCAMVNNLQVVGIDEEDPYTTIVAFVSVLKKLRNLESMSIELNSSYHETLVGYLGRRGVLRKKGSPFEAIQAMAMDKNPFSVLSLPSLHRLALGGRVTLLSIASWRNLRVLVLGSSLDYEDLSKLMDSAKTEQFGRSIAELELTLSMKVAVAYAVPLLVEVFPALEILALQQRSIGLKLPPKISSKGASKEAISAHIREQLKEWRMVIHKRDFVCAVFDASVILADLLVDFPASIGSVKDQQAFENAIVHQ
ncbi:hypothetical protein FA15DRAFT_709759 [Coprinopsis marcescibilis]|uniref:Uncharacterized protein n=1 Tax=Coprinopsis marcescibilis TaxID=230819 RepID=A0A5C3KEW6_COPMA|nr:hypothetical protein FA15DRAFT_709759 [Coprinopsis marcescibilis]